MAFLLLIIIGKLSGMLTELSFHQVRLHVMGGQDILRLLLELHFHPQAKPQAIAFIII